MLRPIATALALALLALPARAEIADDVVSYEDGGITMQGYLAWDDAVEGKRPGVLVVHEWWGHNAYARERARMLARLGYTAFALDMYGDGKTADHPKEAGKFAGAVKNNMPAAEARFRAAMRELAGHETTDPEKMAAIGYCFGGGIVIEMARRGVDLDAVASFHGSLGADTRAGPGDIKASILVANGGADPLVKPQQLGALAEELNRAGADFRILNLKGAKHSFTNPEADRLAEKYGLPLAFDAEADARSWAAMIGLLEEVF